MIYTEATVLGAFQTDSIYVHVVLCGCAMHSTVYPGPPLQWQDAEMAYKNTLALCNDCQYQVHVAAKVTTNSIKLYLK